MSFPKYSEYKDSGVEWLGEVPRHWEVKRLSHYFKERREKASDQEFTPLSVTMSGIMPRLETAAKTQDGDNRKRVVAGDFVINSRSDRKGSSGVSPTDGTVSLICLVLEPQGAERSFVHHLLRSFSFQEEFYRYGKGIVADLWSTGFSEMKNIVLAMPPTEEQRQIGAFLDHETTKIDTLIEEQQRLIELLKEKRQAVISYAVTKGLNPNAPMKDSGVEWLGEIPSHWKVSPLRRVLLRIEQGWSPQADSRPAGSDEWGVIKLSAVSSGRFLHSENKALPDNLDPRENLAIRKGDFLLTRANTPELVGDVAVVESDPGKLLLCDLCYRLKHDERSAVPKFLSYVLRSPLGRYQISACAHGTSGSMVKISHEKIKSWLMPIPPLREQQAIAAHLEKVLNKLDAVRTEAVETIAVLRERRSALISAVVTGKIDVRNWQSAFKTAEATPMAADQEVPYEARGS